RQAPARLAVARDGEQRPADLRMAAEALGAADQPEVEPVLQRAGVRGELVVKALGIVDQIAGVDVEELGQDEARRVGQVAAGSALDLGQVRLADRPPVLLLELAHDLELGDVPAEAAEDALDLAQEAGLLAERHIAIGDLVLQLAIACQEGPNGRALPTRVGAIGSPDRAALGRPGPGLTGRGRSNSRLNSSSTPSAVSRRAPSPAPRSSDRTDST